MIQPITVNQHTMRDIVYRLWSLEHLLLTQQHYLVPIMNCVQSNSPLVRKLSSSILRMAAKESDSICNTLPTCDPFHLLPDYYSIALSDSTPVCGWCFPSFWSCVSLRVLWHAYAWRPSLIHIYVRSRHSLSRLTQPIWLHRSVSAVSYANQLLPCLDSYNHLCRQVQLPVFLQMFNSSGQETWYLQVDANFDSWCWMGLGVYYCLLPVSFLWQD